MQNTLTARAATKQTAREGEEKPSLTQHGWSAPGELP